MPQNQHTNKAGTQIEIEKTKLIKKNNKDMQIIFYILVHIGAFIATGRLSWYIAEPESFAGAIGFIILWGIMARLAYWLINFLYYAITIQDKEKTF